MKYHKIRNVPMEVCTAEQKIAYNLAWRDRGRFIGEYNRMPCEFQKMEVVEAAKDWMIKQWSYCKDAHRYDVDAIASALNAGLEKYFNNSCGILTSYEQVGKMFPAHYLETK